MDPHPRPTVGDPQLQRRAMAAPRDHTPLVAVTLGWGGTGQMCWLSCVQVSAELYWSIVFGSSRAAPPVPPTLSPGRQGDAVPPGMENIWQQRSSFKEVSQGRIRPWWPAPLLSPRVPSSSPAAGRCRQLPLSLAPGYPPLRAAALQSCRLV